MTCSRSNIDDSSTISTFIFSHFLHRNVCMSYQLLHSGMRKIVLTSMQYLAVLFGF